MKTIFNVLIPIAAIVRFYNCEDQKVAAPNLSAEKKIFDSAERKEPKEIDFSSLPLFKLDAEIQKELNNPKPLEVSTEVKLDVLKKLVEYEKHIKDLYVGVQNSAKTGVELARDLWVQDGPKFLREELDEEKLKKVYNWDDANVEHLNELFKNIKSVYENITASLKDPPSPYEIFFSKVRNNYA